MLVHAVKMLLSGLTKQKGFLINFKNKIIYFLSGRNPVKGKLFRQKTVQLIYENARKDEDTAETRLENADKKVAEARNLLEKATQNQINSDRSLEEKKKWRKTVQKRALFLANEAMKEDNSDLGMNEIHLLFKTIKKRTKQTKKR